MNYIKIEKYSTSNGIGLRNILWVSGCDNKCVGCHNPESWNKDNGNIFDNSTYQFLVKEFYDPTMNSMLHGISLLGGEPLMECNIQTVTNVAKTFKTAFPNKTIWCWTGYLFDNIKNYEIMKYIDVLIDGRFEIDKCDLRLKYAGSTNQRVIDVQKSLAENKIILLDFI